MEDERSMADERLTAFARYLDSFPRASVPDQQYPAVSIRLYASQGIKRQYVLLDYDLLGVLVKDAQHQQVTFMLWPSILDITPS